MSDPAAAPPRFRFGPFDLSPARRRLRRESREVRLIPRYFDLLLLLVTERHRAVHRHEIFDRVWADVVVSDGALSQAVRTLRRALGDDPRDPRYIRTVSRHGYQFVFASLTTEPDLDEEPVAAAALPEGSAAPARAILAATEQPVLEAPKTSGTEDPWGPLLDRLLKRGFYRDATDEERRDAAEQLHVLGTREALDRLDAEPGHAEARALLRDARWDVSGAGDVPLIGTESWPSAARALVQVRLKRAARLISSRWAFASAGGALAGVVAGALGGAALLLVPRSHATPSVVVALAAIGAVAGAIGAAGVGAGLAGAEALARSQRPVALVTCGAAGGMIAGVFARFVARAVVFGLFGHDVSGIGGGVEGLLLGAAAGAGYAMATPRPAGGGLATPRGTARLVTSLVTGLACAAAGFVLAVAGRHLVASSLDVLADVFTGSRVGLAPLAELVGESQLRPLTRTLISVFEGLAFGTGLSYGLTHRPGRR
jgi:DNA-binding winged helix-turn-helix (wHTH) protein